MLASTSLNRHGDRRSDESTWRRRIVILNFLGVFYFIYASLEEEKKSLTYSKIWTNDNQVQDFTKLMN